MSLGPRDRSMSECRLSLLGKEAAISPAHANIAVVVGADGAVVQPLFAKVAARWRAQRVSVAGVVAEMYPLADRHCSAGVLRDIVSGSSFPIYLETMPANTTCHLD